jgi:hypothetical protein
MTEPARIAKLEAEVERWKALAKGAQEAQANADAEVERLRGAEGKAATDALAQRTRALNAEAEVERLQEERDECRRHNLANWNRDEWEALARDMAGALIDTNVDYGTRCSDALDSFRAALAKHATSEPHERLRRRQDDPATQESSLTAWRDEGDADLCNHEFTEEGEGRYYSRFCVHCGLGGRD